MIDLHTHTSCSDGTLSPSRLMELAITNQLKAIAITDHDTTQGLQEAYAYLDAIEEHIKPMLISGIECSAIYNGRDIHILGLFINEKNLAFQKALHKNQMDRQERNREMIVGLSAGGFDISEEQIKKQFGEETVITRANLARYLLDKGYVNSMKEAFDQYIGDGKKYYIPKKHITPEAVMELIKMADGIPVLAHPMQYHMNSYEQIQLVEYLLSIGLRGIEAIYTSHSKKEEAWLRTIANRYGLLVSGGSDFHGTNKPDIKLGIGYGNLHIPYAIIKEQDWTR